MNIRKTFLLTLAGVLASTVSLGATHTVTSNADSGDGTLRALVGSAVSGDEIDIPAGMSIELSTSITLTKEKNLKIVGLGTGATVSGTTQRLFAFNASGATVETRIEMRNITFRGVTAEHSGFMYPGCGSVENQGLELVLIGCTFRDFYATKTSNYNGAVLSNKTLGLDLYATNCVFSSNIGRSSVFGMDGDWMWFAREVELVNCTFSENGANAPAETPDAVRGGVLFVNAPRYLIDGCNFSRNEAKGMYCCINQGIKNTASLTDSARHNLLVRNTSFVENRCVSSTDVAMMSITAYTNSFEGCSFISNQAPFNVIGNIKSGTIKFKDCLFNENKTFGENPNNYSHGGLFYYCGTTGVSLEFDSCAFRKNYCLTQRSILTSNTTGGALSFSRCAFEGNCCQRSQLIHANSTLASTFDSCSLVGNGPLESTTSGSDVAPIVNLGTGSIIVNCTVYSNDFRWTRSVFNTATTDLYNSTIVSNILATGYAAVDSTASTRCVRNCVIVDNLPKDVNATKGATRENFKNNALGYGTSGDPNLTTFVEYDNTVLQTANSLKLVCPAATNASKIKLKDGTSPLTLAINETSPLINAGLTTVYTLDGRGYTRDAKPDIGAYEYVAPSKSKGLTLFFR